jgi:transcriptional regulator with XRE-family HTH domain
MGNSTNDANELHIPDDTVEDNSDFFCLFGDRLKDVMLRRCVSCKELAAETYSSPSAITGYRQGRRAPDIAELTAIARILNVSIDYLVGLKETPDKLFPDE